MNSKNNARLNYYIVEIEKISKEYPVPGLNTIDKVRTLARQCLDSEKRVKYIKLIHEKQLDESVLNPSSISFDPIKATSLLIKNGNYDEAVWMCYLGIFFGKHKTKKWSLIKAVYGMLGDGLMTWKYIQNNLDIVRKWLRDNENNLRKEGSFGAHRRYTSIKDSSTGRSFESYVNWIGKKGHKKKFDSIINTIGDNPSMLFDHLFNEMGNIYQFARLGKFDYLCMLGKFELLNIEPGHAYLKDSSGPKSGVVKLLQKEPNDIVSIKQMNDFINIFAKAIDQKFIMQILEDAICNWQKSPSKYSYFGG